MTRRILIAGLIAATIVGCSNTETVEEDEFGMKVSYRIDSKTGQKQGLYEKFEQDGTLYEQSYFRDDELHGTRTIFYSNGSPEVTEEYEDGVLNGMYSTYYEEGGTDIEGNYEQGVMTGIWKRYYPSGQVMEEVTFANNAENGPFIEYHENGKLKAEGQYQGGNREQGLLKLYDENGELYKKMECDDGICRTTWTRAGYEPDADE